MLRLQQGCYLCIGSCGLVLLLSTLLSWLNVSTALVGGCIHLHLCVVGRVLQLQGNTSIVKHLKGAGKQCMQAIVNMMRVQEDLAAACYSLSSRNCLHVNTLQLPIKHRFLCIRTMFSYIIDPRVSGAWVEWTLRSLLHNESYRAFAVCTVEFELCQILLQGADNSAIPTSLSNNRP